MSSRAAPSTLVSGTNAEGGTFLLSGGTASGFIPCGGGWLSVDFGDTSLALGGIKITVRESDELKPIPEYRDALSLTADEVGKIAEDAEEFAGKMATEAFGIFGGLILGGLLG